MEIILKQQDLSDTVKKISSNRTFSDVFHITFSVMEALLISSMIIGWGGGAGGGCLHEFGPAKL